MKKTVFLIGTRWFGVLGPMELLINDLYKNNVEIYVFGQKDSHYHKHYYDNCSLIELRMKRKYLSIFSDLIDLIKLQYYIIKYRPQIIHSFNPKPGLITYFSVLFRKNINFIFCITGLGNTFIKGGILNKIFTKIFQLAGKRADNIFFLNKDDLDFFKKMKIGSDNKYDIFLGAGVNLKKFKQKVYIKNNQTTKIICVARLIWQKGIKEFCVAAEKLISKGLRVEFLLIGEYDNSHPDRVLKSDLQYFINKCYIKHIEWTNEVQKYYEESDINFLHSAREGGPRTILESAATGIPSVGSNRPGVKDLIIEGKTGYLNTYQNIDEILFTLEKLILSKELQITLGKNARKMIAEPLSLRNATNAQLIPYYKLNII
jgi:glycosyltransferase involved in cell wall biosynthesis